jgi:hypothetical protein
MSCSAWALDRYFFLRLWNQQELVPNASSIAAYTANKETRAIIIGILIPGGQICLEHKKQGIIILTTSIIITIIFHTYFLLNAQFLFDYIRSVLSAHIYTPYFSSTYYISEEQFSFIIGYLFFLISILPMMACCVNLTINL